MSWKQFWAEAWQGSTFAKFYRSRRLFYMFLLGWASMAFTIIFATLFQHLPRPAVQILILTTYLGYLLVPLSLAIFAVTDVWADIRERWRRR